MDQAMDQAIDHSKITKSKRRPNKSKKSKMTTMGGGKSELHDDYSISSTAPSGLGADHVDRFEANTKIIAIANHKGGCGKTTTSVNLAAELGRSGHSVLLIDMDPQANASLHIGHKHPSEIPIGCAELLVGDIDLLPQAIQEETTLKNVSLISGSLSLGYVEDKLREDAPRPSEELAQKIAPLIGFYDVIIIDCPPSLKLLSSNALASATHVIIPIESGSQYGLYGVSDLMRHIDKIRRINPSLRLLGALLIRHDRRLTVCKLIKVAAETQLGQLMPIQIPSTTKINQAVILKRSIFDIDRTSKVARAFYDLANHISNELNLTRSLQNAQLEGS
jgi:chromosome partitioning protein